MVIRELNGLGREVEKKEHKETQRQLKYDLFILWFTQTTNLPQHVGVRSGISDHPEPLKMRIHIITMKDTPKTNSRLSV